MSNHYTPQEIQAHLDEFRSQFAAADGRTRYNAFCAAVDQLAEVTFGPGTLFVVGTQTPGSEDHECEVGSNLESWHALQHAIADMASRVAETSGETPIVNDAPAAPEQGDVEFVGLDELAEAGRAIIAGLLGVPVEEIKFEGAREITGQEKADLLNNLGL